MRKLLYGQFTSVVMHSIVEALIEEMEIEEDLLRWNYQPNVHLDLGKHAAQSLIKAENH